MIQGAIFDFDGTLFDSMYLWDSVGIDYLKKVGKNPKPDFQKIIAPMSLYQSACYCQQEYDLPFSVQQIIEGFHQIIENFYLYTIQPKPHVVNFLKELQLQNVRMCIATATDRSFIEAALQRCHMRDFFSEIFTCSEVGHGKDEPVIFQKAWNYLNTPKSQTLVFEDAYHAIQTAKKDGFRIVGVYDTYERRTDQIKEMVDFYMTDFFNTKSFWKFASEC